MRIVTSGVVLLNEKSVLLQLRDDKPSIDYPCHWAIPGGETRDDESVAQGAMRELLEETGYDCSHQALQYVGEIITPEKRNFYFLIAHDGKQEIHCYEGQRMEWHLLDNVASLLLFPGELELLLSIASQER